MPDRDFRYQLLSIGVNREATNGAGRLRIPILAQTVLPFDPA
jgi:hypothetical protein